MEADHVGQQIKTPLPLLRLLPSLQVVRAATRAALRMSTKDGGSQITMEVRLLCIPLLTVNINAVKR